MTLKEIIIFVIIPSIILLSIIIFITSLLIRKYRYKVVNSIFDLIKSNLSDIELMYIKYNDYYDIYVECKYEVYYFKIIKNCHNKILHVTNSKDYYLLDNPTDQLTNKLDIVDFIRLDPKLDKKRYYKVLVLHPNVLQKIYYETDNLAKFIYDDTKIDDINIIESTNLKSYLKDDSR